MCIVLFLREGKTSSHAVCLLTLKGDFTLSGSFAEDMSDLTTMFLSGLTERSKYAVTLKEVSSQGQSSFYLSNTAEFFILNQLMSAFNLNASPSSDDPTILSFKKGELIILIKDDEFSKQRGWIKGQSSSSKKTGAVSTEAIYILPTLSKPSNEVLVLGFHRIMFFFCCLSPLMIA